MLYDHGVAIARLITGEGDLPPSAHASVPTGSQKIETFMEPDLMRERVLRISRLPGADNGIWKSGIYIGFPPADC
jgi:hypothetical protein